MRSNARWLSARPLLFRPRKFLNAAGSIRALSAAIRPVRLVQDSLDCYTM